MGRNTQVVIENNNLCRGPGGMVGSEKKKAPVTVGDSFVSPRPLLISLVNEGRAIQTPSISVLSLCSLGLGWRVTFVP